MFLILEKKAEEIVPEKKNSEKNKVGPPKNPPQVLLSDRIKRLVTFVIIGVMVYRYLTK